MTNTNKYICPLCGANHYNVEDLSACVARDAKAIKEKEAKLKEAETKTAALRKSISSTKKDIENLAIQLQAKVNSYNTMGRQLAALDPKSNVHCDFSISYSEKDSQVDKREIKSYTKRWDDTANLSSLIDEIFNF